MKEILNLYKEFFLSKRGGMFYNLYSYPTKIAPETIAIYIACHTEPGQTVLDMFGGSGSTGLACLLCEFPTDRMLKQTKELGVEPKWGPRNAILYEIGRYGSFASNTLINAPDVNVFKEAANDLLKRANFMMGDMYNIKDSENNTGIIRHIVWSDIVKCPKCNGEIDFYRLSIERNPVKFLKKCKCPECEIEIPINEYLSVNEEYFDKFLNKVQIRKKRKPVLIYGKTGKENWVREFNQVEDNLPELNSLDKLVNIEFKPQQIKWGDLYRSGYHEGINYLHQFYTERNFNVFLKLWDMTYDYEYDVKHALQLWLLSYNQSHSTLMSRVVAKKNEKDFVVTGAQNGVLYISHLPVEKNILIGIESKLNIYLKAFEYINKCSGKIVVKNKSSDDMDEEDKTIDYIFTDPPFGDFIPYSEINQINELWLDNITKTDKEAIISKSQDKNIEDYFYLIERVLKESNRVLKDGSFATLVFHSSDKNIWNGMIESINKSGYRIKESTLLDKSQNSFIQNVSSKGVKKDNLILLEKSNNSSVDRNILNFKSFILKNRSYLSEDDKTLYSLYVKECIKSEFKIGYDSSTFYDILEKYRDKEIIKVDRK